MIWTIAAVVAALGVAIAVLGVYVVDSSENSVGPVSSLFSDNDDSGSDSGTGAYGDVSAEVSYAGGVVTLQGEDTAADAPVVDIFLDFSCPYCADLAASSHEELSDALAEEHGVDADTVEAIRSGEVIDEGNAAFAVNFGVLEERADEVATPSVFVTDADGGEPEEMEMLLDPSTGTIASWVPLVLEDGTAA